MLNRKFLLLVACWQIDIHIFGFLFLIIRLEPALFHEVFLSFQKL